MLINGQLVISKNFSKFFTTDESETGHAKEDKKKPMYLKDYERERLLKHGVYVLTHFLLQNSKSNKHCGLFYFIIPYLYISRLIEHIVSLNHMFFGLRIRNQH